MTSKSETSSCAYRKKHIYLVLFCCSVVHSARRLVRQKPGGFYIMIEIIPRLMAISPVLIEQLIWILFVAFQRC